jgi:alpha-galactosidase
MIMGMWNLAKFLHPVLFLLSTYFVLPPLALGQTAKLETLKTRIVVEAGEDKPRLLSLQVPGQPKWQNRASEALISSIEIAGETSPVSWRFDPKASHSDARNVSFVYDSENLRLRLTWSWSVKEDYGPIEHQIRIENLTQHKLWIPMQDSFALDSHLDPQVQLEHVYVEKGANTPSSAGTHEVSIEDGYRWTGNKSTYGDIDEGKPREIIPWSLVQIKDAARSGWYVGIEFSGRTRISLESKKDSLNGAAGLNPDPGPFQTRLKPGESFDSPVVFIVGFSHGLDGAGNILRPWVRAVLGNPET